MKKLIVIIALLTAVMIGCSTKTATEDVYMGETHIKEPQGIKEPTLMYKAESDTTEIIYTEYNKGFQGDYEHIETYLKVIDEEGVKREGDIDISYSIRPQGVKLSNLYGGSGNKEESSGTSNLGGIERLKTYLHKEDIKINREFYTDNSERDMDIEVVINGEKYKLERVK